MISLILLFIDKEKQKKSLVLKYLKEEKYVIISSLLDDFAYNQGNYSIHKDI